jgi:hypothetical protein
MCSFIVPTGSLYGPAPVRVNSMPSVYLPGFSSSEETNFCSRRNAEEVIDVVEFVVLDEQRVSAEARAVGEDDAAGICIGDLDIGEDLVGTSPHADGDAFRNRSCARIIELTVTLRFC